jgi:hypothetical protein
MRAMLRTVIAVFRRLTNPKGWHHHLGNPTTMRRVTETGAYEYRDMTSDELNEAISWQAHR